MVYVTCSFFIEENEDRLVAFCQGHSEFVEISALDQIIASGLLTDEGRSDLEKCATPAGALRLTPARMRADGFFITVLTCRK